MQSSTDVPILIVSDNARAERRISPVWTIDHLRSRLEPITGIPVSSQSLTLRIVSRPTQSLDVDGETLLSRFPLQNYAEIHVSFSRLTHKHIFTRVPTSAEVQKGKLMISTWCWHLQATDNRPRFKINVLQVLGELH